MNPDSSTWSPTTFLLMAEYGQVDVRLERIAEKYFGMSQDVAKRLASTGTFPVKAYRASGSKKAPWLVRITDLAEHLDACRTGAEQLFRGHNGDTSSGKF